MSPEGFLQSRGTLKNEQWQEAGVEGRLSLLFFFHVWAIVLKFKCNTQCIICPHKLPLGWFILSASFSGVPSGFLQVVPSNNDSSSSRNDPEWLVTWQTCGSSFVVNAEQRIWECFFSLSELCCSEHLNWHKGPCQAEMYFQTPEVSFFHFLKIWVITRNELFLK